MEVNERIKMLRRDLNLTQPEFARRIGISRSMVNNIERGVLRREVHLHSLIKLMAKTFDVSEEWLLTGNTNTPEYIPSPAIDVFLWSQKRGMTEEEAAFISTYLTLSPKQREAVITFMSKWVDTANSYIENLK